MTVSAENIKRIQELRAEGLLQREVADRLGLARSTVSQALIDPTGEQERERRKRYQRRCACGALMTGSEGLDSPRAPKHCRDCAPDAQRRWTKEAIIAAVRHFAELRGRPPTASDWNPSHARALGFHDRADLFERYENWPHVFVVQYTFGSWNAGIRAAGFEPLRRGAHLNDWTRDEILAAIRRWYSLHGEPPRCNDWKLEAYSEWPNTKCVTYLFGTWNAAIRAAGFTPRKPGGQPKTAQEAADAA